MSAKVRRRARQKKFSRFRADDRDDNSNARIVRSLLLGGPDLGRDRARFQKNPRGLTRPDLFRPPGDRRESRVSGSKPSFLNFKIPLPFRYNFDRDVYYILQVEFRNSILFYYSGTTMKTDRIQTFSLQNKAKGYNRTT